MSYIPVMLQKCNDDEEWSNVKNLYAKQVNTAQGSENFAAAAEQYHLRLSFKFSWCSQLEALRFDPQHYRLVYGGQLFNIVHYDDYMESHINVYITGECYG